MAKPGKRPVAVADKALRGNPGRRPLTPTLPAAPGGDMFMPTEIADNERAAFYWKWYLQTSAFGHLSPVDSPLLAGLCIALAWRDTAIAQVEKAGMLVDAPNAGIKIQNQYMAIANKQQEVARKLAVELSLTVAERSRVAPTGVPLGGAGPGRGKGGGARGSNDQDPEAKWIR